MESSHEESSTSQELSVSDSARDKRFRWDKDEKVNNLIRCLANYKSQMEFANSDFNADKVKQYEEVRAAMAKIYAENPNNFGPPCLVSSPLFNCNDESLTDEKKKEKKTLIKQREQEKKLIKKGYQRIHEKLKEIRQNFSVAVTTGRRSGSGKIVLEFYDQLVQIWGGTPATQPLSFGANTEEINGGVNNPCEDQEDDGNITNDDNQSTTTVSKSDDDYDDDDVVTGDPEVRVLEGSDSSQNGQKRKMSKTSDRVPKLIDNKRKHLQRQLSAAQRDKLLLQESKEDSQFKRDVVDAMKQSDKTFADAMTQMSQSIAQVGQCMAQSMQIMGQVLLQNNNQNINPHQQLHTPSAHFPHNYVPYQFSYQNDPPQGNISQNNSEASCTYQTL